VWCMAITDNNAINITQLGIWCRQLIMGGSATTLVKPISFGARLKPAPYQVVRWIMAKG